MCVCVCEYLRVHVNHVEVRGCFYEGGGTVKPFQAIYYLEHTLLPSLTHVSCTRRLIASLQFSMYSSRYSGSEGNLLDGPARFGISVPKSVNYYSCWRINAPLPTRAKLLRRLNAPLPVKELMYIHT